MAEKIEKLEYEWQDIEYDWENEYEVEDLITFELEHPGFDSTIPSTDIKGNYLQSLGYRLPSWEKRKTHIEPQRITDSIANLTLPTLRNSDGDDLITLRTIFSRFDAEGVVNMKPELKIDIDAIRGWLQG